MTTPPSIFNGAINHWKDEQLKSWARLKYDLTYMNLSRHLPDRHLSILDAGGGNGFDALPLARAGHDVTIVDYSAEMLQEAQKNAREFQVADRVTTHLAELSSLQQLYPAPSFDVVLCHNVVQYVEDLPALLQAVLAPLRPGGIFSLITVNHYSVPYHAAFMRGDLQEAREKLDPRKEQSYLFDVELNRYTPEEILVVLERSGCVSLGHYGIRCICDYWGNNELKSDPEVFDQLSKLEMELSDRYPYKLLARYFQLVGQKHEQG